MSKSFDVVRKGYDPQLVDAFVRDQAEAWRAELTKASNALQEWRQRAEEMTIRVQELERQAALALSAQTEATSLFEAGLWEARLGRDEARTALEALREEFGADHDKAQSILDRARAEATRATHAAEAEIHEMYASARRRIAMAETHAEARWVRDHQSSPTLGVSLPG